MEKSIYIKKIGSWFLFSTIQIWFKFIWEKENSQSLRQQEKPKNVEVKVGINGAKDEKLHHYLFKREKKKKEHETSHTQGKKQKKNTFEIYKTQIA